jgi:hypothetical protein
MNETTPTPAEQESTTRITTVSVRIKTELDAGYLPFLRYMKKNNYKNPPFGMRDATRATFEVYMSASIGDDMTPEQAITMLSEQGYAIADRELRQQYPDSFPATAKVAEVPGVPDEAFIVSSTVVERPEEEI